MSYAPPPPGAPSGLSSPSFDRLFPPLAKTRAHIVGMIVSGGIPFIAANAGQSEYGIEKITACVAVFFMLLGVAFVAGLVAAFRNPLRLLAAIAIGFIPVIGWLVALYYLTQRWEFVKEHSRAVWAGLFLYTVPYVCVLAFIETPALAAVAGAAAYHFLALSFYAKGYRPGQFLQVVSVTPVLLLLMVLPFIDFDADFDLDFDTDPLAVDSIDGIGDPDLAAGAAHGTADPDLEWVDDHVRTAPDGNPYNNLSYDGPGAQPPGETYPVDGYWRSTADGIESNNLG